MAPPPRYTMHLIPRTACTPSPLHVELEGTDGTASALVHPGPTDSLALQACLHSTNILGTLSAVTVTMRAHDGP